MANLSHESPTALLRIVQPVVGGKKPCIHTIVNGHRLTHFLQKTFHANREWSKPPIETNHQNIARRGWTVMRRGDTGAFRFIKIERIFTENVLARIQSCDYLRRMQVVTRRDDDCIDRGIAEDLLLVGGTGTESKFFGGMSRVRTGGRPGDHHFDATNLLDGREQSGGGEASCS